MQANLVAIERRLQKLVEGICRLLPNPDPIQQVCSSLAGAFQDSMHGDMGTGISADSNFLVRLHPANKLWEVPDSIWIPGVVDALNQIASEYEIILDHAPRILLRTDPGLAAGEIRISSSPSKTARTRPAERPAVDIQVLASQAFFILPDSSIFPLEKSVLNIGRGHDNHLRLEDPRVSKRHAQIRAVRRQFFLFDLGSASGTYINGKRITQESLSPGDVVSLGGVSLIFGQEKSDTGANGKDAPQRSSR